MACRVLQCGHCGVGNAVGICSHCGQAFVISASRAAGGTREFDDQPLDECPPVDLEMCDFCDAKMRGENPMQTTNRGLRQRTCVACRTEFLSGPPQRTTETLAQHNRHLGVAAVEAVKANFAACQDRPAGHLSAQARYAGGGEKNY